LNVEGEHQREQRQRWKSKWVVQVSPLTPISANDQTAAPRDCNPATSFRGQPNVLVYRPVLAASGVEALQMVSNDVNVILLDLIMPEMDRFQLLRQLRESKPANGIPVLVLTSKDLTDDEKQLLNREAKAFFQKGLNWQEELLAQMRSVTSTRELSISE